MKYNNNKVIERYKIKLVVREFSQRHEVNYDKTFLFIVKINTLRLFLAIVAKKDLECYHVNVNNAFTKAILMKDIYLTSFEDVNVAIEKILKINKSLYELKQTNQN